ncbi:beta-N-acetylhexosaminidase [Pedobacter sp. KBW06]|uniref:beta-N-acetylhexosaminidase n=1 Tax=Pedobacter sp. KBW06 TaxID=2153359 RepID=UPI001F27FCB1|nr:beta-N-acetylhexosaminidase [Pedobacter sp. KBW06]
MMKLKIKAWSFALLIMGSGMASAQDYCPVIPAPVTAAKTDARFVLNSNTPIIAGDVVFKPIAQYLQEELLKTQQMTLSMQPATGGPAIRFVLSSKKKMPAGAYSLEINRDGVTIAAKESTGAFYAAVSLLQVIRQSKRTKAGLLTLTGWKIEDEPGYGWRGFMLDESRHFFGMEKLKSILDWMAFYKLNKLHWHLTDEPAWRIEIKRYPKLALVGGIGNYVDEFAPAQYYTQEQIKEVVAYAAARFITVIPEIDMPGHATAANKAYPEFSGGGTPGHPEFTFNPGKEATYTYLSNILKETNVLFPSAMVHLGGDEVSYGNQKWAVDPEILSLMKDKNLAGTKEVETYFMKRMADSLFRMNAKLLVWDEMTDAGLPKDKTIIFWWRQDKPEVLKSALNKGYETVLCPRLPLYFDFVQDSTHRYGRKWNKTYNALENVYAFSGEDYQSQALHKNQILGIQANLWTETVQTEQRLDYLLFPRITALAEAAWSVGRKKDFPQFMERLKGHLALYEADGIYYYDPFQSRKYPEPVKVGKGVKRFNTEL